jgi:hypothetical protein
MAPICFWGWSFYTFLHDDFWLVAIAHQRQLSTYVALLTALALAWWQAGR